MCDRGLEVGKVRAWRPAQTGIGVLQVGQIELADFEQQLAQVGARGGGVAVGPEEGGQRRAGHRLGGDGQVGQQPVAPFGPEGQRAAGVQVQFRWAEQSQVHGRAVGRGAALTAASEAGPGASIPQNGGPPRVLRRLTADSPTARIGSHAHFVCAKR